MFRDERYERGSRGSSSLAKKAEAAFKISLARRSSAFSRRSRFSSADSSLDAPARVPASTSACRTHLRTVSPDTFSFAATEQIASHCDACPSTCSNTNATALSRNSREYLVLRTMIHILTQRVSLHQTRGGSDRAAASPAERESTNVTPGTAASGT